MTGTVYFDEFFQGANDNERMTNLNKWSASHNGKRTPAVVFDTREYLINVPIMLNSGLVLLGGSGSAAREYGRHTAIRYNGTNALFQFPLTQTNQGYPSDGSPRDISVTGIEFRGPATVDCIESVVGNSYAGRVLWMSQFHNCGFVGWRRVWWGFGDGFTLDGVTHFQAFSDTVLDVRGSECSIFGRDGASFMDSGATMKDPQTGATVLALAGKPMIRLGLDKSRVGQVMVTTRKAILAMHVYYGQGTTISGFAADSQSSDPCYGANIKIDGNVQDLTIVETSFKGHMSNPGQAAGGLGENLGIIHVNTSGRDIIIQSNAFQRKGSYLPSVDTPLVFAGPNVPIGGVRVGLNAHAGYSGVVRSAKAGQIISLDPTIKVAP